MKIFEIWLEKLDIKFTQKKKKMYVYDRNLA